MAASQLLKDPLVEDPDVVLVRNQHTILPVRPRRHRGPGWFTGFTRGTRWVVVIGGGFIGGSRAEHWASATEQPMAPVANLLAGRTVRSAGSVRSFWSDQYGARVPFAGRRQDGGTVWMAQGELADRAPAEGGFLVLYERDGRTTAVLSVDRPRPFMEARRELVRGETRPEPAPR